MSAKRFRCFARVLVIGNLLRPELDELIDKRDFSQLRTILAGFPPADIAEILADLEPPRRALLLRILPKEVAGHAFEHLTVLAQERTLEQLGEAEVAEILNALPADDRTALLEELPSRMTQRLLGLLTPEKRRVAAQLLGYPENSVGRRMTPDYVAIGHDWTVGDVLAHLRRLGQERHPPALDQLYVVDSAGRLVDCVRLQRLVVAEPSEPVSSRLEGRAVSLAATDDQEAAVAAFRKYDATVLPVLDSTGVLLGVVTVDDVLDVAEAESTEDIQKLGGQEALHAPYLDIGLFSMVQKRAGWLALLFLGEMLTASAMGHFEDEIERAAVLAMFVPLIISSGGNSGSQATSLLIRSLALGEVRLRDWWRVLRRELAAGLMLGTTVAVLGTARILLWQGLHLYDYGPYFGRLAATVACSLVSVVLFGSLAGAMLPFILRALRLDPATASAPLVATLVDVTGLVIYFTIAFRFLHGTLL